MDEQRHCIFCGISFQPKRANQLYCSIKHRNRLVKQIEINCKFCHKTFWRERINQEFCSKNCSRLNHLKNYERPKIPKSVFNGSREQIVEQLTQWLEDNDYIRGLEDED